MNNTPNKKDSFLEQMLEKSGSNYIKIWDIIVRIMGPAFAYCAVYYLSLTIEFTGSQLSHFLMVLTLLVFFIDLPRTMFFTRRNSRRITEFLKAKRANLDLSQLSLQALWNETINFPLKISKNIFGSYVFVVMPFLVYMRFFEGFTLSNTFKLTIGSFIAGTTIQLTYFFSWEVLIRPLLRLIREEAESRKEKIELGREVVFKVTIPRKIKIGFLSLTSISLLLAGTLGYTKLVEGIRAVRRGIDPSFVITSFNLQIFMIAFVTLVIILLLSFLLSHSVNLPLQALTEGIDQVSVGKLDTQVEVISNDELGKLAQAFNVMIVNIRKNKEEIERQNVELKKVDRLKSMILANTSHELKTPINQIKGIVEELIDQLEAKENGNKGIIEDLRSIAESGEELNKRVNNILDSSKLAAGATIYNFTNFDLRSLVEITLLYCGKVLERSNKRGKIKLLNNIPVDLGYVYGDQRNISTLINNLVRNALKFTEEGEIKVSARIIERKEVKERLKGEDQISKYVLVSVQDTGIGIKQENQEIIFEQFRQANGSLSRGYGGTGLGLYICKSIVEDHNGIIWVESEYGKGAAFYFIVPFEYKNIERRRGIERRSQRERRKEDKLVSLEDIQELNIEDEYKSIQPGNGELILIVDDEITNVIFLKKMLEGHGYRVITAYGGEEGLDKLYQNHANNKNGKIELVILDLMMPQVTGYDFCKEIRKRLEFRYLPVIMLTVMDDLKYYVYSCNLGADDYITKPVDRDKILAKVNLLLKDSHIKETIDSIMKVSGLLVSEYELKKILRVSLEQVKRLMSIEKASIMLVKEDGAGKYLKVEEVIGISEDQKIKKEKIKCGERIAGYVWEKKLPLLIKDIRADKRFREIIIHQEFYHTNSAILSPIIYRDNVLGIISAADKKSKNVFNLDDLNYLIILSDQIAMAITRINDLANIEAQNKLIMQKRNLEFMSETVDWISHEVNNPAQAIMANVDLLYEYHAQKFNKEKYRKCLGNINDLCRRIRNICEIIRSYGKLGIRTEALRINELIQAVLDYARMNLFEENEIELEQTLADKNIQVYGDRGMLELTFLNMVKNSYKSIIFRRMKERNITGKIKFSQYLEGDHLCIGIEDNGQGIKKEEIANIFNRNFSTTPDGRGIGLFLAKKVINDHGGKIEAESELNEFTRLTIKLPLPRS